MQAALFKTPRIHEWNYLSSSIKRTHHAIVTPHQLRKSSKMLHHFHFTLYLATFVLVAFILVLLEIWSCKKKAGTLEPPLPFKLPIIGHLHLLAGYKVPYQGFTELARKFGKVFRLKMGYVKCVVVNGQKNIREVLVTNGHHFDSRPNFDRYQQLFSGNKENSLAFCDWSNTQKTRRDMLKVYTFPRAFTHRYHTLEELISNGTYTLMGLIQAKELSTKEMISRICANIFTQHFCSKSFKINDSSFVEMVEHYDDIFFEVNQGYAADFLPFLMPLHRRNLRRVKNLTHGIRQFVTSKIIGSRFEELDLDEEPDDYVESLIRYVKQGGNHELSWDSALFALEDIIGGHSAVSNFLLKVLAFISQNPEVHRKIQDEIEQVLGDKELKISDRNKLPYTEASIFEAIRLIASPIVPRVANRDSTIDGYHIEKGSVIFLNNYDLSMSEDLWEDPIAFKPERFVKEGRLIKPDHFLPFGGGRRSCMGYKMVQLVSFGILGRLMQIYDLKVSEPIREVPVGSLALPRKTFNFEFMKR